MLISILKFLPDRKILTVQALNAQFYKNITENLLPEIKLKLCKGKLTSNISVYSGELGFDGKSQNGRGKAVFIQGYTREGDWINDEMNGIVTETLFGETNVG